MWQELCFIAQDRVFQANDYFLIVVIKFGQKEIDWVSIPLKKSYLLKQTYNINLIICYNKKIIIK